MPPPRPISLSPYLLRYEDDLRELNRKQTMRVAEKVAQAHKEELLISKGRKSRGADDDRADKSPKIALVTAGSRGLGLAIVRGLCKKLPVGSTVILTGRNPRVGAHAVETLKADGAMHDSH